LVREKKAVSEPEKKAERKRRPITNENWIKYMIFKV
jgi:hypothetical protein